MQQQLETKQQREAGGHAGYHCCCVRCVAGEGCAHTHVDLGEGELPDAGVDSAYSGRGSDTTIPLLVIKVWRCFI